MSFSKRSLGPTEVGDNRPGRGWASAAASPVQGKDWPMSSRLVGGHRCSPGVRKLDPDDVRAAGTPPTAASSSASAAGSPATTASVTWGWTTASAADRRCPRHCGSRRARQGGRRLHPSATRPGRPGRNAIRRMTRRAEGTSSSDGVDTSGTVPDEHRRRLSARGPGLSRLRDGTSALPADLRLSPDPSEAIPPVFVAGSRPRQQARSGHAEGRRRPSRPWARVVDLVVTSVPEVVGRARDLGLGDDLHAGAGRTTGIILGEGPVAHNPEHGGHETRAWRREPRDGFHGRVPTCPDHRRSPTSIAALAPTVITGGAGAPYGMGTSHSPAASVITAGGADRVEDQRGLGVGRRRHGWSLLRTRSRRRQRTWR